MKQRALLLDRDGIINIDHGYVGTQDRFEFCPGILALLRQAQDKGFRPIIVTNQSGVARGYYTERDFQTLTTWMREEMAKEGVHLAGIYACFNHKDAKVPEFQGDSFWRKPNPGMILTAALDHNLDLARSIMLGDSLTDMQAAQAAHVSTCLWLTEPSNTAPDGVNVIHNLAEAERYLSSS